ncbi:uncharacterized protein [Macrobrachium rosenbergii]|uniref:uncharacterized protein n=1 Tax=Macrobrachium rosenbergii TaxID=79674 RepID=UPI0034D602A7
MSVVDVLELLSGEGWQERLAELNRDDLIIVAQHFELEYEVSIRKGVLLLQIYEYIKTVKAGGEQEVKSEKGGVVSVEILDRQIALRKVDLEIEKFKAEERERERQHEIAMRGAGPSSPPTSPNRSVTPAINLAQALKFVPQFEENNVAEFFVSFERIAARLEWPQEYWTTLIQSKLVGRAQKVYVTLEEDLSSDYESVKAIVLKAYELVPEAYRQRFRNLQKCREQTFVEFARSKEQYASDWLKSKEVVDFDKLKELMLVEEFKRCVPDKLKVHLEELKLDTIQEVAIARNLKLAIVDKFPVKDVDIVIGNDVALKNNTCPILVNPDHEVAVVTRSSARIVDAAESTIDVDLSSLDRSGSVVVGDIDIMKNKPNWTVEELIKAQKKDFQDISIESGEVPDLTTPKFKIIKNILYRLSRPMEANNADHEILKQIMVPYVYRNELIALAHESGLAGHFGIHKTSVKLLMNYYWPKLKADVKKFVNSCDVCQKVSKPNQPIPKAPLCPIPVVSEPFKEVIIDVVGPLPRTRSGNEYIFTIMDKMSRYPEAIPLHSENIDENCFDGSEWLSDNKGSLKNFANMVSHLSNGEQRSLKKLVFNYKELFSDVPGRTSVLEHDVDVGNATPVKQSPYRLNPFKNEVVAKEVDYMLKHDLIEPSQSPWSSPVVLVKKSDGDFRLCFDYRKLNELSKSDCYPLPRIEDCIDRMGKAKYISKFDLLKGYWQVPLSRRARALSAFVTPQGLFQCKVMPFGMKNAAATFQRLMNTLVYGLEGCVVYIDDIVIYSDDWGTHLKRIRALFEVLKKAGLVINLKKSEFAKAKVVYLGHEVGGGKVAPKQANIECIEKMVYLSSTDTPIKILTDHNP